MDSIFVLFGWMIGVLVFLPALVLAAEVAASFLNQRKREASGLPPSLVVIVPAHNESRHLKPTLDDLKAQLWGGARVLVVADNCSDDTASIAASCGVDVIERHDPERRGKGYALQFGIDALRETPPDCIAFFDADCRVEPGTLPRIARLAAVTGRPVQSLYEMTTANNANPRAAIGCFAWIMMNRVRMKGLSQLADVTRFTGVGLAAMWEHIVELPLGRADITEDHAMTFMFARRGVAPVLDLGAKVTSMFPQDEEASVTQRARWENGSLRMMIKAAAPATVKGALALDRRLFALGLDGLVPPLGVFAAFLCGALGVTACIGLLGGLWGPFTLCAAASMIFGFSIVIAWLAYGRSVAPLSALVGLAPYILQKFKIYGGRGRQSAKRWTKTERD